MTATPRVYGETAKTKAENNNAILCSMDDNSLYGEEFYRLGFGEAVSKKLLSDYRVLVLAVDENHAETLYKDRTQKEKEKFSLKDYAKLIGCINGLAKKTNPQDAPIDTPDIPMKTAIMFSSNIKTSVAVVNQLKEVVTAIKKEDENNSLLVEADHVDGTMSSIYRSEKLHWLKENQEANSCRILSNARCLSEGVDIPALDAVIFTNPKNSQVDVVQAVGRVMRKANNKNYGYIIIPIVVNSNTSPEEALNNNKEYQVVWSILQALRSHDERFEAMINQIQFNKKDPKELNIIGVGFNNKNSDTKKSSTHKQINKSKNNNKNTNLSLETPAQESFTFLGTLKQAIYAKLVIKCGNTHYWEDWAKDVGDIVQKHMDIITTLLNQPNNTQYITVFNEFIAGLHNSINDSITQEQAIGMLAQHIVCKPVFDALFGDSQFTKHNGVSIAMDKTLSLLQNHQDMLVASAKLQPFYDSLKERIQGINTPEGKQKLIKELYEKFFLTAFKQLSKSMGLKYTPNEVVSFIIHSVEDILKQHFNTSISNPYVNVLDPFTGTGTFITQLLLSGLIKRQDLARKYKNELHANEIILLAYYIAAINIENTYHDIISSFGIPTTYTSFENIVFTDTFQMNENDTGFGSDILGENAKKITKQKQQPITVIIGNPPYSARQERENDDNKNTKYPRLDSRIEETYAKDTTSKKTFLYDSYIRAIRWASDRIANNGIVAYVTNGYYLTAGFADGLRKCLLNDFCSVYIINLKGNSRNSKEGKNEGGNVFDIQAGVAITILVKNPNIQQHSLQYYNIGDNLKKEEKLKQLQELKSMQNIKFTKIIPNQHHDWLNHRNEEFTNFAPLGSKEKKATDTIFNIFSSGVLTGRDGWALNFNKIDLANNMQKMVNTYNQDVLRYNAEKQQSEAKENKDFNFKYNSDASQISWSDDLKKSLTKGQLAIFNENNIRDIIYRPFSKHFVYYDKQFNYSQYQLPKIFPSSNSHNLAICVTAPNAQGEFSALMVDSIPEYGLVSISQCFPLYSYGKLANNEDKTGNLLADLDNNANEYTKQDNISDAMLNTFRVQYNDSYITKEDIFYYVYGILHSTEYKTRFADSLTKELPRIPFAENFIAFKDAGKKLANLHLNYESATPYPLEEIPTLQHTFNQQTKPSEYYNVTTMRFPSNGKVKDKTTIIYNSHITLKGIPAEAYNYKVLGKSAIEWIMDRYSTQPTKAFKESGNKNDPNLYSPDPMYIINLLKRIVTLSIESVNIIENLPPINEIKKF